MNEYGGYMPLELNPGQEYFQKSEGVNVERFNCGRNAIAAVALSLPNSCFLIPYYNCNVVMDTLKAYNIPFRRYYLDENLEPKDIVLQANEWLLYPNYFGIAGREKIKKIESKYKRVIFDNTQAFFSDPILGEHCYNIYSPRKFVGVSDGAYLVWGGENIVNADYPQDISWSRASFLFKSIECGTNSAYRDNLESQMYMSDGIKKMSVLTQKMLSSIDYDRISMVRDRNYRVMTEMLDKCNCLKLPLSGYAPFVYPLYVERDGLRESLVGNKIYVPQWWKYLIGSIPENSIEARLTRWLLPLPIDHRYSESDIINIVNIVLKCLG